jgi:hypothetical protein
MTDYIFGDSWGYPWKIPESEHFFFGENSVNYSVPGYCLSAIRDVFVKKLSEIVPGVDTVFFVIPPDIRLYWPNVSGKMKTWGVVDRVWKRCFKNLSLRCINTYFDQVIGSECLALQSICRDRGITYGMWNNYGVLDFDKSPYMTQLDCSRFVSNRSMMAHLLGYEAELELLEDGPSIELTNTSDNFLANDQHPSVAGHRILRKVYLDWLNTTL